MLNDKQSLFSVLYTRCLIWLPRGVCSPPLSTDKSNASGWKNLSTAGNAEVGGVDISAQDFQPLYKIPHLIWTSSSLYQVSLLCSHSLKLHPLLRPALSTPYPQYQHKKVHTQQSNLKSMEDSQGFGAEVSCAKCCPAKLGIERLLLASVKLGDKSQTRYTPFNPIVTAKVKKGRALKTRTLRSYKSDTQNTHLERFPLGLMHDLC